MRFGFYKLDSGKDTLRGESKSTASMESDLSKLFLLSFMAVAMIIGYLVSKSADEPSKALQNSIEITLERSFMTSLEGSVSLGKEVLESYRSRYRYNSERGMM